MYSFLIPSNIFLLYDSIIVKFSINTLASSFLIKLLMKRCQAVLIPTTMQVLGLSHISLIKILILSCEYQSMGSVM